MAKSDKYKSCGFLILRQEPTLSFLLMRHPKRWDLPKGHVDAGETNLQCALRELDEETGIQAEDIEIVDGFKFKHSYFVNDKRNSFGNQPKKKKLIVFAARLIRDVKIKLTEHESYEWFPWEPPHQIQEKTIDPLLAEFGQFVQGAEELIR